MAYDTKYNGNVIYYDPYQTINATNALGRIKNSALEQSDLIAQDDQYFNNVPERYACLIPSPRFDGQKPYIDGLITDAYDSAISTLSAVTNAIIDYCNEDGVFTAESKAVLDSYLKSRPSGGDGGFVGAGGSSGSTDFNGGNDSKLEANNGEFDIIDSEINKMTPNGDGDLLFNEEIIISEAVGAATVVGGLANSVIGSGILSANAQESLLDNFSTSVFGTGINVPSPIASSLEKLSKSGVIGPAALAVFATTGLGGKVFYDRKHDDDDDESDDDILELNKKSGSSINSGFISGSMVTLRHNLLEAGEVVE